LDLAWISITQAYDVTKNKLCRRMDPW